MKKKSRYSQTKRKTKRICCHQIYLKEWLKRKFSEQQQQKNNKMRNLGHWEGRKNTVSKNMSKYNFPFQNYL